MSAFSQKRTFARGFDFLGYHFSPAGLTVAKKTIANFFEKASRLYEQKRRTVSAVSPLEMYVRRWMRWALSGAILIPVENTIFRQQKITSYSVNSPRLGSWRSLGSSPPLYAITLWLLTAVLIYAGHPRSVSL